MKNIKNLIKPYLFESVGLRNEILFENKKIMFNSRKLYGKNFLNEVREARG